ncbi:MAG: formate dehydrogenase subunit alpha [Pyrinomonadaceae bacterium]
MITAKINGRKAEFEENISILDASRLLDIEIPTLCHDDRLKPSGACRLCLVEVKGRERPVASCETELRDGAEVETQTTELERARRMNLRMLARSYPLEAFRDFPDKPFHRLARRYGLGEKDFAATSDSKQIDSSHPYISVDMSRCVDCYRCVRICNEVQGQFVWQVFGMGKDARIVPDFGGSLSESRCVACGACVDTCPTGALEDRSVIEKGPPERWTRTVCPYCGTGCEMDVGTRENRIVRIDPVKESPVNRGHLCVKGTYAFDFVHSPERMTEPMIRKNGKWRIVDWDEAFAFTAEKLKRIVKNFGPDSAAVLGSARATNEENYLAQKFARVCLGTNNVDNCARVCHTPSAAALKIMLGAGAATNSFRDIEFARSIMICGANPTENHPILGSRIKRAVLGGNRAKLIVIDPRRIELAKYADIHLQLRPGTNIALLNAIACAIIEEDLIDAGFIAERVSDFENFSRFILDFAPEKMADICGVPSELIRRAARIYASEKPSMCVHGLGTTEHIQGTEGVMGLINLALITGNLGKRGAGVNPLRGQNNVQGAGHMGCDPGVLTGSIGVEEGRSLFERVWKTGLPERKGLNLLQMIDRAGSGDLKALWAIGYDVFLTNANANETARCLENLELMIVQDLFLNETARRFAHVFLPAASSFEKDGTFMNGERRVSRVRKTIEPLGNCKSDWEIICGLAEAFGRGEHFAFRSAEEIWNEVREVWPGSRGITYQRIEKAGLQWDCPNEDHPGTEILHTESFGSEKRSALRRIKYVPTRETVSPEFPFLLNTGRTLYHFNAGTMTRRTKNRELRPTDLLYVSPADAATLRISDGQAVKLRSRFGEAELPVRIAPVVRPGELFATFHDPEVFLNRLTTSNRDRFVQTPEYKVTAVKIEKIARENGGKDSTISWKSAEAEQ